MSKSSIRDTVLRSLSAIGATKEAKFYAELFAAQDAERFALIVIDPRCLKNPLLEALISNLRILSDLGLSPVLLVGALDDDRTSVKFQAQRLTKDLDQASVKTAKLNTASYQLIPEVRQKSRRGMIPILEMTERRGKMSLHKLVTELKPNKVIFLQPSGGLSRGDERLSFVNIDRLEETLNPDDLTLGQSGLPYLSKFWVSKAAQGEGIARDIWDKMCADTPAFFWRSRMENPFNEWYLGACDGMQISGDWRVFWKGLEAPEVPGAIIAAASAPDDFETE